VAPRDAKAYAPAANPTTKARREREVDDVMAFAPSSQTTDCR
jgi:hypothetical protein